MCVAVFKAENQPVGDGFKYFYNYSSNFSWELRPLETLSHIYSFNLCKCLIK